MAIADASGEMIDKIPADRAAYERCVVAKAAWL
jgi:hypothetical protein